MGCEQKVADRISQYIKTEKGNNIQNSHFALWNILLSGGEWCEKKNILFVCMALTILLVFSSCSQNKKFVFDGSINWESTSSDVLKEYGTPTSTEQKALEEDHTGSILIYENEKCFGYDGFKKVFLTIDNDNKLFLINIGTETTPVLSKVYAEDIYNSLVKSYGKPVEDFRLDEYWANGNCYWTLDDTIINLQWTSNSEYDASNHASVSVQYIRMEGSGLEEYVKK